MIPRDHCIPPDPQLHAVYSECARLGALTAQRLIGNELSEFSRL